jgi:hypothetical protein
MGEEGTASRIHDFGTRWKWVVSLTARPLRPWGKSPRYPLDRRLVRTQSPSGSCGKENNFLLLREIEHRPYNQLPPAIPTEPSQNLKVVHRLHTQLPHSVRSQLKVMSSFVSYSSPIYLNIIFPSAPRSLKWTAFLKFSNQYSLL